MHADFTTTPAARKGTKVVRLLQGSKSNQGRTAVESFVRQFPIQKAAAPFALFVIDFTVFTGPAVWLLTSSTWRSSPSINQGGIVASLLTHSSGLFLVGVVLAAVVCFFFFFLRSGCSRADQRRPGAIQGQQVQPITTD